MSGIRLPIVEDDDETEIESSNIEAILLRMLQDTPTGGITTVQLHDEPQTPPALRHRYDNGMEPGAGAGAEAGTETGEDEDEEEIDEGYDDDDMMIDYGDEGDMDPVPRIPRNTVEFVDRDAFVPCEMCQELIAFMDYSRHLEICGMRHNVYRNTLPSIINRDFILPQRVESLNRIPIFIRNVPMSIYESHDDTVAEIGLRLIQSLQSGNEYQYNLLMQELMGGPVRIGVPDIDAVCPVDDDETIP
jgi:hypothetical protein